MRFDIMTLFPETVDYILGQSIIGRAQKSGAIQVFTHNIRDYSEDKHRRVDDTPYGGGKGMLMAAPPIWNCYNAVLRMQAEACFTGMRRVIYLSPAGRVLRQEHARTLATYDSLILLCGHYEGVDYRIVEEIVDEEISVGDYVLTGGEIPACILTDCVARPTRSAMKRKAFPAAGWNIRNIQDRMISTVGRFRMCLSAAIMR